MVAVSVEEKKGGEGREEKEVTRIVEAILFTSPEPISPAKIARVSGINLKAVREALRSLVEEYRGRETAIEVIEVAGKYAMRVKPEYHGYVDRFRELDMERGMLRTLAVIALRQPIKMSELAKIRGNRCYEHVRELEEMGFVKAEKSGKTKILTTTRKFAEYFGLKAGDPESVKEFLKKAARRDAELEKYIRNKT